MSIDWFTFFAQIINFLILVVLLRWFLYEPIVHAMQQREERIADQLDRAKQERSEAETLAERYRSDQRKLDEQREKLLKEARKEAQQQREQWNKESRRSQPETRRMVSHAGP